MVNEELKTLNDLNTFFIDFPALKIKIHEPLIRCNELREEAIKWVKKYNERDQDYVNMAIIERIINFFNLTEEDLNGK